jgi:outer membrane protein OmpA-like peptidoglycan-associated protein
MNANLLSLAQEAMGGDFSKLAGQFLGESPGATQSAMGSLLPAVLGSVAHKGATTEGASSLLSLINGSNLDVSSLGNIAGLFGGGGTGISSLMKLGTSTLVPALFGDKSGGLVNALSSASGIKSSSATSLLSMVVPVVLMFLKKFIGEKSLNASSLSSLLSSQGPHLQSSLDSRITNALGFASPTAYLSGLGGQAADAAKRAGAAVAHGAGAAASTAAAATAKTSSGFMRWLPWIIGAIVLLFLWNMFSGKPAPTPAPAPAPAPVAAPAIPAPAPTAPAVVIVLPAKVYFDVGSPAVGADEGKKVSAVADMVKKDNLKVSVTGYTDKTGDVAKNEELAKNRAAAVRDGLKAAGVPETSIEMRPPMFVETGAAGGDAEARRVEISKQ